MMVNELDTVSETSVGDECAGRLTRGTIGMLLGMAVASGLAFLGGMLIGKRQGEARGLEIGRELGRTEAAAAIVTPRTGRRFWRREGAA
jgi:hypothetical protein